MRIKIITAHALAPDLEPVWVLDLEPVWALDLEPVLVLVLEEEQIHITGANFGI
jgi:hypothetical protein